MANKHETLTSLFSDIADAIREKTKETSVIKADDFPSMIKAIKAGEGQFVWKKLTAEGGDFVDYVISSDSEAYPDGGELDGYWYELVEEGIPLESLGCTKYAIDKFTFTSDTLTTKVFAHSLEEIPVRAIIIALENFTNSTTNLYAKEILVNSGYDSNKGAFTCKYLRTDTLSNTSGTFYSTYVTESTLSINSSTATFKAGIEYTLITMA